MDHKFSGPYDKFSGPHAKFSGDEMADRNSPPRETIYVMRAHDADFHRAEFPFPDRTKAQIRTTVLPITNRNHPD